MAKFIALKDVSGGEHVINVDHIIRLYSQGTNKCLVVLDGLDIAVDESARDIWARCQPQPGA